MQRNKKVSFFTLGCKLNFSETSSIVRSLEPLGYTKVDFSEKADICIINTCSVTDSADRKCRQAIKKAIRTSPEAYIVVVGCYAQLKPSEISSIAGVDLVLGINERFNLTSYIQRIEKSNSPRVYSCEKPYSGVFSPAYSLGDRTRSFLKVQDGCDYHCSYCTIPGARGDSRNQPIKDCVKDAETIAASGIKEIVISGVNIGDFGKSTGEDFYSLLEGLLSVKGIERYRISSIEPDLLSNDIINLAASNNAILPHFHIPLQNGSNRILALMRRRYKRELFAERVKYIKSLLPYAAIGADVIVGFPGETEEDFNETLDFLNGLDLSYLHPFSFSPRNNTPAANMSRQIEPDIKHQRSKTLQRLSEKKRIDFYRSCTGKTFDVLWETGPSDDYHSGFTENYIKVTSISPEIKPGEISRVTLSHMDENGNFIV